MLALIAVIGVIMYRAATSGAASGRPNVGRPVRVDRVQCKARVMRRDPSPMP